MVLLEIALWRHAATISSLAKSRGKINREAVRRELMKKAEVDLPHWVGSRFAAAVQACFAYGEMTDGKSEFDQRLFFRDNVIVNLERIP